MATDRVYRTRVYRTRVYRTRVYRTRVYRTLLPNSPLWDQEAACGGAPWHSVGQLTWPPAESRHCARPFGPCSVALGWRRRSPQAGGHRGLDIIENWSTAGQHGDVTRVSAIRGYVGLLRLQHRNSGLVAQPAVLPEARIASSACPSRRGRLAPDRGIGQRSLPVS
jgi:hypothetical protein